MSSGPGSRSFARNPLGRFIRRPQNSILRSALFQVHLWSGLIFGLYVVVISLSGSAVVFREEMNDVLNAHLFASASTETTAEVETVVESVGNAYPEHRIGGIYPPGPERQTYRVYVSRNGALTQVFADPATGRLLGELTDDSIVRWLQELHFHLLAGSAGEMVNAVGALAVMVMCLTGLIIWWPGIENWKRALVVDFRKGWKRITWELHRATGFWILALLFIWAVSGIYFLFPSEFRSAVNAISPLSAARATVSSNPALKDRQPAPRIRSLIERTQRELPGSWIDRINLPADDTSPVTVVAERDTRRTFTKPGSDYVYFYFDRFNGELLQTWENTEPTAGDVFMSWMVLLHLGNFGGVGIKILWVVLGLLPPLLFVTGAVMWWNRVVWDRWRRATVQKQGFGERNDEFETT